MEVDEWFLRKSRLPSHEQRRLEDLLDLWIAKQDHMMKTEGDSPTFWNDWDYVVHQLMIAEARFKGVN